MMKPQSLPTPPHRKVDLLFPTPLWTFDGCGLDTKEITDFCYVIKDEGPGRKVSNIGDNAYQSLDFMPSILPPTPLYALYNKIMECAYSAADEWGFQGYKLDMGNLWININGRAASNMVHTHPGCILSGVYYAKLPACCEGSLVLCDTYERQHMKQYWADKGNINKYDDLNKDEHTVFPKEDSMHIFPAWVPHYVDPNMNPDGDDRISISFNLRVRQFR